MVPGLGHVSALGGTASDTFYQLVVVAYLYSIYQVAWYVVALLPVLDISRVYSFEAKYLLEKVDIQVDL